jgi:NADPH:quinone reductase-like Zn-dependent oxidoreductase
MVAKTRRALHRPCLSSLYPKEIKMKAAVYHDYGSPDVLRLEEVEKPTPADGEVLVKIHAAAVLPFDWHFLTGTPFMARLLAGPLKPRYTILGSEVAGRVEAVGAGVRRFQPGDEVFGHSDRCGGYAEYVCIPEAALFRKPVGLSFEEAAALHFSAITALVGLCELGGLEPGQTVLINGASGGVGSLAVRIARLLGAAGVTGVCGPANLDMVRSLGADRVVDYTREDFAGQGERYDLIFDAVAKRSFANCRPALAPGGVYVTTAFSPGLLLQQMWVSLAGGQRMAVMPPRPPGKNITDRLEAFLRAGELRPIVGPCFPLSEVRDALRAYEAGHAGGRVVITM